MSTQERLRKADYCVLPVPQSTGRRLIRAHHYTHSAPSAAVVVHGLFARADVLACLGVAWWMPPPLYAARGAWEGDPTAVLVLSRLAIAPEVPANAASFLIGGSVRLIRHDRRWRCLLSYADTAHGHTGAIYRAANWEYCGLVPGHTMWRDEGRDALLSDKTWTGSRSPAAMRRAGYQRLPPAMRHKYRLILSPARPPRTLFDRLRAPPALDGRQQEVTAIGIISTQEHTRNDRAEQTRGTERSAGHRRSSQGGGRPAAETERAGTGPLSAGARGPGHPGLGDL